MSDLQSERDMIVRAEAQLQESIKNITSIRAELSNIYDKIEKDAKETVKIGSEVGSLKETTLDKIAELNRKLSDLEDVVEELKKDITDKIDDIKNSIAKETKSREVFQGEILASFKTTKLIATIISGIFGIIAVIFGVLVYFKTH